jgi:hypothetical protein
LPSCWPFFDFSTENQSTEWQKNQMIKSTEIQCNIWSFLTTTAPSILCKWQPILCFSAEVSVPVAEDLDYNLSIWKHSYMRPCRSNWSHENSLFYSTGQWKGNGWSFFYSNGILLVKN